MRIKTVLIPKDNKVDVEELAAEITRGMQIIPVVNMDEVLREALVPAHGEEENKAIGRESMVIKV